eukprot:4548117-Pleurochrysis_carterae.AAC.1
MSRHLAAKRTESGWKAFPPADASRFPQAAPCFQTDRCRRPSTAHPASTGYNVGLCSTRKVDPPLPDLQSPSISST